MPSLTDRLTPLLNARHEQNLYRRRPLITQGRDGLCQINGRPAINFASNDYLGLAEDPRLLEAACTETPVYGAGAAHLVSGHHLQHHLLEDELADWIGCERALLFSTGYMANLAVQQALMQPNDWILADKLNHASLIDGALASPAELKRYPHLDMTALEKRLQNALENDHQSLIVTDGVFSMDGDIAPLPQIVELQKKYQAWLFLDDAHGLGVLGENGRGSFEYFGITPNENTLIMGTLGKALGTFGAFVAGSDAAIEALIQFARPYIYTTAMPVANATATRQALKIVQNDSARRAHLHSLIEHFRSQAEKEGLPLMPSDTPIQPVMLTNEQTVMQWAQTLSEQGFWVGAIRPPTVPRNSARLRITLSAAHSIKQINALIEALANLHQNRHNTATNTLRTQDGFHSK